MGTSNSPYVALLATGGTIASRSSAPGSGALAADTGDALLASAGDSAVPVRVVDVMTKGSYLLTFADLLTICTAIRDALADPAVLGVVVTHGTDTTEETAYLAQLVHDDQRAVVFTGAQHTADHDHPDGPGNLRAALSIAAAPTAVGQGVLVAFAGTIHRAAGVRKVQTVDARAFGTPDTDPAGTVTDAWLVDLRPAPPVYEPLPLPALGAPPVRVDVVASHPDADGTLLRAALAAGARGIVLQGTGNGNANPALCAAVAEAAAAGVVVVVSTRVHAGPVMQVYGAGGGRDLHEAGAIPSGLLRPSQARILLQLLLTLGMPPPRIAEQFARRGTLLPHAAVRPPLSTPSKG
ncbi:asparaginase [Arthrobacter sp. TMN-37]